MIKTRYWFSRGVTYTYNFYLRDPLKLKKARHDTCQMYRYAKVV